MTGDRPFRINPPRPSEAVAAQADRASTGPPPRTADLDAADLAQQQSDRKARRQATTKALMSFLDIFEHRHTEPPKLVQEIIDHFDLTMAENLGTFSVRRLQRAEKCFSAFVAAIGLEME